MAGSSTSPVSIAEKPRTCWRNTEITKKAPCRTSHWRFWVSRPRLEVRLVNSRTDTSGARPFFSLAHDVADEQGQDDHADSHVEPHGRDAALVDDHGAADRVVLRGRAPSVDPALQDPEHHEEQAQRREHRAEPVECGPLRRQRWIGDAAAQPDDRCHDQHLQDERRPPADVAGDQPADQGPRRGADPGGAAHHAEVLGAGGGVVEQHGDEDVDRRDQQR